MFCYITRNGSTGVVFSSHLGSFMPPKRTTRNSLNSYFEMAESANSSADVPVSSALPASTSPSGNQSNVPYDSSSSPALSVETLTASIVGALRPLFASAQVNQLQSLVLSLPSTSLMDLSNLPLAVSSLLVASSSAPHLPSAVQTPSTGRSIVVPSFVNTFTAPAGSSRILPSSLSSCLLRLHQRPFQPVQCPFPHPQCLPSNNHSLLGRVFRLSRTNWFLRSPRASSSTLLNCSRTT